MAGDGETVTPSLPEPDVWTGMALTNVIGALRWKRRKPINPSRLAAKTLSSRMTIDPDPADCCNWAGSIYIHTWSLRDPVAIQSAAVDSEHFD